ncbi:hypothetical protein T484DRAFT_1890992 [Baffinella frigidus]|nr:hypothetical protein T484DRAFT_1890992 [Cryptophyta sp. CCMP2293]
MGNSSQKHSADEETVRTAHTTVNKQTHVRDLVQPPQKQGTIPVKALFDPRSPGVHRSPFAPMPQATWESSAMLVPPTALTFAPSPGAGSENAAPIPFFDPRSPGPSRTPIQPPPRAHMATLPPQQRLLFGYASQGIPPQGYAPNSAGGFPAVSAPSAGGIPSGGFPSVLAPSTAGSPSSVLAPAAGGFPSGFDPRSPGVNRSPITSTATRACPPRAAPPSPAPLLKVTAGNFDSPAMPRAPLGAIQNRASEAGLWRPAPR